MRRSSRLLSLLVCVALHANVTPTRIAGTISSCSQSQSVLAGCTSSSGAFFQRRSPTPSQSRQPIEPYSHPFAPRWAPAICFRPGCAVLGGSWVRAPSPAFADRADLTSLERGIRADGRKFSLHRGSRRRWTSRPLGRPTWLLATRPDGTDPHAGDDADWESHQPAAPVVTSEPSPVLFWRGLLLGLLLSTAMWCVLAAVAFVLYKTLFD